ncbi:MAG: flagellar protein, partial [Eubacteriales bacterium]|nr:flagellar protein [Eubacteriales bacterium]
IEKAKEKGINGSLVLVDNIALVVNVKKNIVITAIQNDNEKVYSNIDGAVIV